MDDLNRFKVVGGSRAHYNFIYATFAVGACIVCRLNRLLSCHSCWLVRFDGMHIKVAVLLVSVS